MFGVKVGVELPAGTLAATPEDRTPAERHTPPASRVARVWPLSHTPSRLQFYTTTLDDSEQRRFPPNNTQASGSIYLVFAG